MDTKDYRSYAQMKPEGLNHFMDFCGIDTLKAQKGKMLQQIAESAKVIQGLSMDVESIDVLVRLKMNELKFGDLVDEYTDDQLDYLKENEGSSISPLHCWKIKGVVGKWTVLEDIHSIRNATRNVENFPSKNFIKK